MRPAGHTQRIEISKCRSRQFCALCIAWRCCINRARSVDVYAQRSRGQPPYQVRFQSHWLIFYKKMRKDVHKTGEPKTD
ncbi:MAG: hypothetical protein V3Q69_07395 [Burkholderia sp.]